MRDQANKCFDVYLQRIRKYGNSLPDTILPPPAAASSNGVPPRMGTPQNDNAGWAGWAISSFTNKLATASGDMQPKAMNTQLPNIHRSSSMPPANTAHLPLVSASVSTLHRQAVTGSSISADTNAPAEQYFRGSLGDEQGFDEAWGDLADDDSFDAHTKSEPGIASIINFDDGGEPDFEGWLKAQAQAKKKPPLPKGLKKPSGVTRTTTTGSAGNEAGQKILASAVTKAKAPAARLIDIKPKEMEDDWGDAWE